MPGVWVLNPDLTTNEVVSGVEQAIESFQTDFNSISVEIGDTVSGVNQPGYLIYGRDEADLAVIPTVRIDPEEPTIYRLVIEGKVSTALPPPPVSAVPVTIPADTPLTVNGSHDTTWVIPNGKIFKIQQIVAGAQGDAQQTGSKIEVIFDDGTEHLIERMYVVGFTEFGNYPDTKAARDGSLLLGNGTNSIIIRRDRIGGNALEIDAVVRGYYN